MCDAAGRHLSELPAFSRVFSELHAGRAITLEQVPEYHVLLAKGEGPLLREPGMSSGSP